ncbi:MAG: hypothetical protein ACJA1P_000536 [Maribacter sp.]|jgi:hypothetical protein
MKFFKKCTFPMVLGLALTMGFFSSCEEELTTIGSGVVGAEAFASGTEVYDVFTHNKNVEAVRTNRLPIYQLGRFTHGVYGNTEGSITTQLQLSTPNPIFGSLRQSTEETSDSDDVISTIEENETVKEVYLYIPYLTVGSTDRDLDGVVDALDVEPENPDNDSDGDGVSNSLERVTNTDPWDTESLDANADGINDTDDKPILANNFAQRRVLDSIYGAIDASFRLKVEQSTYFLRDLDPNTNFQESQAYFSTQEFSPNFVSDVLYDSGESGELFIDDKEILLSQEDNETTDDVDESLIFGKLNPGIRVPLDKDFFQEYILNKEGSSDLFSQSNFSTFLRGIHISLDSDAPEGLMLLLDLRFANIQITYTHDSYNANSTNVGSIDVLEKNYQINLITPNPQTGSVNGNAVNTLINDDYPTAIAETLDTDEVTSRIYLKGGAGIFAEIDLFDSENGREAISQIKAENWIVNEANLVFYIDRDQLDMVGGIIEPPRLYLYNSQTNVPLFNPFTDPGPSQGDPFPLLSSYPNYDGVIEKSGEDGIKYSVKITDHINNLVLRDSTNVTLGLTLATNISLTGSGGAMLANDEERFIPVTSTLTPLGTVLFGSNIPVTDPDFDKRLKLEISYTKVD